MAQNYKKESSGCTLAPNGNILIMETASCFDVGLNHSHCYSRGITAWELPSTLGFFPVACIRSKTLRGNATSGQEEPVKSTMEAGQEVWAHWQKRFWRAE